MKYQIIATLGPCSQNESTWKDLLLSGATSFRLNTSHLAVSELRTWLDRLVPFLLQWPSRPTLTLDLQGSKWRLGEFSPSVLASGQPVELVFAPQTERANVLPVPHLDFFRAALLSRGDIVLNDAKIHLVAEAAGPDWLKARVRQGGEISPHKGITLTASDYRQESLNDKDRMIIAETRHPGLIRFAISYLKDSAEIIPYRALVGPDTCLVAKLERDTSLVDVAQIAEAADELWLCRGDLGAELGLPGMAAAVHKFSLTVCKIKAPVLLAGQVLEHMTRNPTPTRSEVCTLYNALADGYRGFVLSDETAIGRYPLESCRIAALFKDED